MGVDLLAEFAQARALEAWALLSEGISRVIPAMIDQYGPYRCGPTYPLLFTQTAAELRIPKVPWAWHPAGGIWKPIYPDEVFPDIDSSLLRLARIGEAAELSVRGAALLTEAAREAGAPYGSEVSAQAAVARFLACSDVTARHVMTWNIAKRLLLAMREKKEVPRADELFTAIGCPEHTEEALAALLRRLAEAERENVKTALTSWEEDSAIGFEASMEYAFNREMADWKPGTLEETLALLDSFMAERRG